MSIHPKDMNSNKSDLGFSHFFINLLVNANSYTFILENRHDFVDCALNRTETILFFSK